MIRPTPFIYACPRAQLPGLQRPQDGRGLLCMANMGPHSNGCEFYVTLGECEHLQGEF